MGTSSGGDEKNSESQPADLYRHIESWWGEEFDDRLIERIVNAPLEHQTAFLETLLYLWDPEIERFLAEMPPGILRPALPPRGLEINIRNRLAGLRLLLYAHEIVLDSRDFYFAFDPFRSGSDLTSRVNGLRYWLSVRPLVEDGSIKLTPIFTQNAFTHEYARRLMTLPDNVTGLGDLRNELPSRYTPDQVNGMLRTILSHDIGGISSTCQLAAAHRAHTLALNRLDEAAIRVLLERPVTDNRQIVVQKLAALKIPAMNGDISELVKIRGLDADFGEWRNRLGYALSYVGELGEDDNSLKEASEVVYSELSDGLKKVEKATEKSPALRTIKGEAWKITLSGISGITTGAIAGHPWIGLGTGLAGGVAPSAVDSGLNYAKALQERRKGRLIMDVAMLFDPHGSDDDRG